MRKATQYHNNNPSKAPRRATKLSICGEKRCGRLLGIFESCEDEIMISAFVKYDIAQLTLTSPSSTTHGAKTAPAKTRLIICGGDLGSGRNV